MDPVFLSEEQMDPVIDIDQCNSALCLGLSGCQDPTAFLQSLVDVRNFSLFHTVTVIGNAQQQTIFCQFQ